MFTHTLVMLHCNIIGNPNATRRQVKSGRNQRDKRRCSTEQVWMKQGVARCNNDQPQGRAGAHNEQKFCSCRPFNVIPRLARCERGTTRVLQRHAEMFAQGQGGRVYGPCRIVIMGNKGRSRLGAGDGGRFVDGLAFKSPRQDALQADVGNLHGDSLTPSSWGLIQWRRALPDPLIGNANSGRGGGRTVWLGKLLTPRRRHLRHAPDGAEPERQMGDDRQHDDRPDAP
jgi:hypothetical protein